MNDKDTAQGQDAASVHTPVTDEEVSHWMLSSRLGSFEELHVYAFRASLRIESDRLAAIEARKQLAERDERIARYEEAIMDVYDGDTKAAWRIAVYELKPAQEPEISKVDKALYALGFEVDRILRTEGTVRSKDPRLVPFHEAVEKAQAPTDTGLAVDKDKEEQG